MTPPTGILDGVERRTRQVNLSDNFYFDLNDGADTSYDRRDTEFGSTKRAHEHFEADINEQHSPEEDEQEDEGLRIDTSRQELLAELEDMDTEQPRKRARVPIAASANVWKFFTTAAMPSSHEHNGGMRPERSIRCRFPKCTWRTLDSVRQGSTSNMISHVGRRHCVNAEDKRSFEDIVSSKGESEVTNQIKNAADRSRAAKSEKLWIKLFSEFTIPFTLIDNPTFKEVMKLDGHMIPFQSRRRLTRKLDAHVLHVESTIREMLDAQAISIHIAMDLWESPSSIYYLSVVGTFVDTELRKKEVLLGFEEFTGVHTGSNIADEVYSTLKRYHLLSKLTGVTSDGAANHLTAIDYLADHIALHNEDQLTDVLPEMSSLFDNRQWFHCAAHVLNLLSTTFLTQIFEKNEILQKVRKVASIIRRSAKHRQQFSNLCLAHSLSATKPPSEVATGWNASYLLLAWFMKYRLPIAEFLRIHFTDASDQLRQSLRTLGQTVPGAIPVNPDMDMALSSAEWRGLHVRGQLLKKFYDFTEHFNKIQSTPSDAIVAYYYLGDYLHDLSQGAAEIHKIQQTHDIKARAEDITEDIQRAAKNTQKKRQKYFDTIERVDAVLLSHLLDARYKRSMWDLNLDREDAQALVESSWSRARQIFDCIGPLEAASKETVKKKKQTSIWSSAHKSLDIGMSDSEDDGFSHPGTLRHEWDSYLKEPRFKADDNDAFDPLNFWKSESAKYPILAQVARVIFAFAPTSTSCERSFSLARNKIGFRRHSLSSRTLSGLLSTTYNSAMEMTEVDVDEF